MYGTLRESRAVLTVWTKGGVPCWGAREGHSLEEEEPAEIDQGHVEQDLRAPWQEFGVCFQRSG